MKILLKICKGIIIGVLAIIILLNVTVIIKKVALNEQLPMVLGFGTAVILTGSMEPTIIPGDIVIIHNQEEYEIGDIVTYQSNSTVTHRIVEKTSDGYITQGDANNTSDGEIEQSRIIGKVLMIIPKAGNVILFFQSQLGMVVLIISLFAMIEVPRLITYIRKNRNT